MHKGIHVDLCSSSSSISSSNSSSISSISSSSSSSSSSSGSGNCIFISSSICCGFCGCCAGRCSRLVCFDRSLCPCVPVLVPVSVIICLCPFSVYLCGFYNKMVSMAYLKHTRILRELPWLQSDHYWSIVVLFTLR